MEKRWYVVRTKPRCDALAASAMGREGLEMFFPRVGIVAGDRRHNHAPLFPGYLFLRCDVKGYDLPLVSRLPGVLGLLGFGEELPSVPDEVITELRSRVETLESSGGLWDRFKPGELVRVAQGKLEGLAKVVEEPKSPEDRVRILLEFMGRQVCAVVPWHSLSRVRDDGARGSLPRLSRRTRGRGRWIRGFGPNGATQS